jgi:Protein kinase domain
MAEPLERPESDSRNFSLAESALSTSNQGAATSAKASTGPSDLCATVPEGPGAGPQSANKFGRYQCLEELPLGGMGIVYKARDPVLNIDVALKTLRSGLLDSTPDVTERFAREARVLARLDHPHIVRIYDVGQHEGRAYFAMGFMPGGSLDKCADRFKETRSAVALVAKIARAVHYVHENGILHRDLKPANILLDEHGEPRVTDFGLAKYLEEDVVLTHTGVVLGTPSYMAPEQARGDATQIGRATDIWALGVILYELLAGRRPFQAASRDAIASLICTAEPPHLRTVRPGLDRALEIVTLKCLEKKPEDRFASAAALADELERWLAGESILTPALALKTRSFRFVRRHTAAIGFTALATIFVAGAVALWGASNRVNAAKARAEDARQVQQEDLGQVQKQLARGDTLQLIPLRHGLESYNRRLGQTEVYTTGDSLELGLRNFGVGLLDLLPERPRDGYRFNAEVNINRTTDKSGCFGGIYVAAIEWPGPNGFPEKWFLTLGVGIDIVDPGAYCHLHRYFGPSGRKDPDSRTNFVTPPPSKGAEVVGTWHRLRLDVAPHGITPWWNDAQIGFISIAALDAALKQQAIKPPVSDGCPSADLMLRGAPGLFNRNADTLFRNVTVEPLP